MKFEWDEDKNNMNIYKHKISFEDASTVFDDINAVTLYDEKHSDEEERFIIIGKSERLYELNVCHCYRGKNDDIIRIISARRASKKEIEIYYGGM
ncbi:MAG: BrnT family toxin [Oscillospiraceae bacterium]|nr:BrnT family toxin [Oscillospiraceae bacterium]